MRNQERLLVALADRVGARDGPEVVRAVATADEHLLAVEHVLVAVAAGVGLRPGEVRACLGAGEELPGDDLAREDRRQQALLLLLGAPHEDARAAEGAARVVVRRQSEVVAVDLLGDHDGVVDGQSAAAVLGRRGRPQPAPRTELAAELAVLLVVLVGVAVALDAAARARRATRAPRRGTAPAQGCRRLRSP